MGYYQAIVNAVITVTASCRLPGDFSLGYITAQTSLQTVTDIRLRRTTHYMWAETGLVLVTKRRLIRIRAQDQYIQRIGD